MGYKKAKVRNPPMEGTICWCALCDWRLPDSFSARRRLGEHLVDDHYDEIVFPLGTEPPDLESNKMKRGKK
jgi:hypothetical protein